MKERGKLSPQAAAHACGLASGAELTLDLGGRWQHRTTRLYRIAELMGRYRPEHDTDSGKWHLFDIETSSRLDVTYTDEATAKAGARLRAACDIDALYDDAVGR